MTMQLDIDAAIIVPVNIAALISDTDFKTRDEGIAYNESNMNLVWNFQTMAGVVTQTAVTPTTGGGDYDWSHLGDAMYAIGIPASGGASINNDTEGYGWFSGLADGVLPWRGPTIQFLTEENSNATSGEVGSIGSGGAGATNFEAAGDNTTRDTIDNAAAVDKGSGLVGIPVTGHAFIAGREVTITGTTFYDAAYEIISQTTDEVVITATYNAETFAGSETINSSVKGIEFVGTITANTYLNIAHKDGVTHDMDDDGDIIDIVYIYNVGGGRTGTIVNLIANLNGNSDEVVVKTYNRVASAWETVETLKGAGGSSFVPLEPDLLNRNTGTGADLGDVFIRFATESTSPNSLAVDKLTVAAVNIGQSVGYTRGRVHLDTVSGVAGVESFVNGVGDNHSLTIADVQALLSSVNLKDIQVINGSTVVLGATMDNRSLFGDNWILDLDGRSVTNAYIEGASSITGICTCAPGQEVHFEGGRFLTATVQLGHFDFCGFAGTITLDLAGDYNWHNCYSNVPGPNGPVFTKTAGQTITGEWRYWSGSVTLSGIEAGDVFTISGELGTVTLNGAEGVVEIRGTYKNIVDNRSGTPTLNTDGAIRGVDVASILADTTALLLRIPAALFTGITSMAQWLGLMAGKQTGDATARTEIRATGAGSGTFDETDDAQESLRDQGDSAWVTGNTVTPDVAGTAATLHGVTDGKIDAVAAMEPHGTPMRGTENAALASVLGALADAASDGDPTSTDTIMQYAKQLINILVGSDGVTTFPAEAAPGDGVSLAEVLRAVHADVTGIAGNSMLTPAEIWDLTNGVETSLTPREAMRLISTAAAGVLAGAGTTEVTIKGAGVAITRITATVDEDGNRSVVVLNV